jgi:hypothetical protein
VIAGVLLLAGCGSRTIGGDNQNTGPDAGPSGPSIDNIADGGWRDSTAPWHPPGDPHQAYGMQVWSHPGAVYTAYHLSYVNEENGAGTTLGISVNRGSGWSPWVDLEEAHFADISTLRGFPDGNELVVLGIRQPPDSAPDEQTGIFHLTASEVASFTEGPNYGHLFIVDEQLAYIAAGDRVIRLDVDHWEPLPVTPPYDLKRIWATANVLFGVASGGIIVSLEGDQWRIHDSGTLANLTAIWGFAENDIWVCDDYGNLLHYDGAVWTRIDWPDAPDQTGGYFDMWGSEGVLYLYRPNMLVRYSEQGFEVVADWRCPDGQDHCETKPQITDLWGNAPDEVFLVVDEGHYELRNDGWHALNHDVYLLYFDGEVFHWF